MVTITAKVTLPTGVKLSASKSVAVTAPKSPLLVGVTPDLNSGSTGFDTDMATFTTNGCARAYGQTTCPQWTDAHVAPLAKQGTVIAFSAKTASLAEYVSNWDAMPANVEVAYYTYFHERNRPIAKGAPALATCQTFDLQLIAARNAHKNKARIKIGPCFSWYPAAIGHNEGTPWAAFMKDATGKKIPFDFMAWDQYNVSGTSLEDPAGFISLPVSSAATWGVPLGIWEFGVNPTVPDTAAAAWLTAVVSAYDKAGVLHAMYWNSLGYKINARPAPLKAWQGLCTAG